MYYDEIISESKNNIKTTRGKKEKKEIGNNNCHTDTKSVQINNTITNNPQEIANTFNDYFLTAADTVIGNIKKVTVILGILWIPQTT
jgi:hypothetical protein